MAIDARTADAPPLGRPVRWLFAGLLAPIVVLAIWLYAIAADHPWRDGTTLTLTAYGALLLCLLGGVSIGMTLSAKGETRLGVITGVAPVAMGLASILTPTPYCFALLAVSFAAQGAWDAFAIQRGQASEWFARMRSRHTIVVVAAFILAFVATAQPG